MRSWGDMEAEAGRQGTEVSAGCADVEIITDLDINGSLRRGGEGGAVKSRYDGLVLHWVAMERAGGAHENTEERRKAVSLHSCGSTI